MNIDAIKQSESASFKKRNPHIFGPDAPPDAENKLKVALAGLRDIPERKKKRIRQSEKPLLNRLENEFYQRLRAHHELSDTTKVGDAVHVVAQGIRFALGNGISYKPDFVVFFSPKGTVIAYECKGPHAFRGGFENLKVAANKYPLVKFVLVWKDAQGQWQEQHVLP